MEIKWSESVKWVRENYRKQDTVSVPDAATKIKGRNVEILMRRKTIYNLLNSNTLKDKSTKDKGTYRKGQLWKLFPKLSDFTKLKSRKQNSKEHLKENYPQRSCNFTSMFKINNGESLFLV